MPGWSPDGRWISYVSNKSGSPEIWLWSTEDGHELKLTNLGARINSMTWSPDERWIAFAGDRYGNYDIWRVSVPEGKVDRLTDDKRYEVFPTWTPDASHILYVRLDEAWADHDVIVTDANGNHARTVVGDRDFFDYGAGTRFGYPRVSADGEKVLFPSHRSGWINYWGLDTTTVINTLLIVDLDADGRNDIVGTLDRRAGSGLSDDRLVWYRNTKSD